MCQVKLLEMFPYISDRPYSMDITNETLITVSRIAQRLGEHRETIHLWITGIKGSGLLDFPDCQQAKKGERKKRQVAPIIKGTDILLVPAVTEEYQFLHQTQISTEN